MLCHLRSHPAALCHRFMAMTRHIPQAGGFYAYVGHGLGRGAGLGAAFLAVLSYTAVLVAVYGLHRIRPQRPHFLPRWPHPPLVGLHVGNPDLHRPFSATGTSTSRAKYWVCCSSPKSPSSSSSTSSSPATTAMGTECPPSRCTQQPSCRGPGDRPDLRSGWIPRVRSNRRLPRRGA